MNVTKQWLTLKSQRATEKTKESQCWRCPFVGLHNRGMHESRITCLPEYFACYGSRNENRDWIKGRGRGLGSLVGATSLSHNAWDTGGDSLHASRRKRMRGSAGRERNVLEMQYTRAIQHPRRANAFNNNEVSETHSDLFTAKEIIRCRWNQRLNKKLNFFGYIIKYHSENSKSWNAYMWHIFRHWWATQHVYVACTRIYVHKSSRKIPGKLAVRLSYNLVKRHKRLKIKLKETVWRHAEATNVKKVELQPHTDHPSIIPEILTMCTKKEFPVVHLPRGWRTGKRFMPVSTNAKELIFWSRVPRDCVMLSDFAQACLHNLQFQQFELWSNSLINTRQFFFIFFITSRFL